MRLGDIYVRHGDDGLVHRIHDHYATYTACWQPEHGHFVETTDTVTCLGCLIEDDKIHMVGWSAYEVAGEVVLNRDAMKKFVLGLED